MKNLIIILVALISTVAVNAQEFDTEAITKMSDGVCECLQTKEHIDTKEKAEMEFGFCIMKLYNSDVEYYDSKNMKFTDQSVSFKVGEQVGTALASSCPAALKIFMMIAEGVTTEEQEEQEEQDYEEQEYIEIIGKIITVDAGKFNTFEIKDEDGRTHKVLWLTYVDNDDLLEEAKKGKIAYVFTTMELDIYDPRIGEYRNMLILDRIDTKQE
jgi:hypothetical protein